MVLYYKQVKPKSIKDLQFELNEFLFNLANDKRLALKEKCKIAAAVMSSLLK
jgi:hypothetical protein